MVAMVMTFMVMMLTYLTWLTAAGSAFTVCTLLQLGETFVEHDTGFVFAFIAKTIHLSLIHI